MCRMVFLGQSVMMGWGMTMRTITTILLGALMPARVQANDAAVETAAGGLQLRNEKRISIAKERLSTGKQPFPS